MFINYIGHLISIINVQKFVESGWQVHHKISNLYDHKYFWVNDWPGKQHSDLSLY